MKYKVFTTKMAIGDLKSALNYIANQLLNKTAADKLKNRFKIARDSLSEFPSRCPKLDDISINHIEIHFLILDDYIMFFIIDELAHKVHIIRFLHSHEDWNTIVRCTPILLS